MDRTGQYGGRYLFRRRLPDSQARRLASWFYYGDCESGPPPGSGLATLANMTEAELRVWSGVSGCCLDTAKAASRRYHASDKFRVVTACLQWVNPPEELVDYLTAIRVQVLDRG